MKLKFGIVNGSIPAMSAVALSFVASISGAMSPSECAEKVGAKDMAYYDAVCYKRMPNAEACAGDQDSLLIKRVCYVSVEGRSLKQSQGPIAIGEVATSTEPQWGTPLKNAGTSNRVGGTGLKPERSTADCLNRNTASGLCIRASGEVELGHVRDAFRYNGGNEAQIAMGTVELGGSISQEVNGGGPLSGVSLEVRLVPRQFVNDYQERPTYNNANRLRSDGYEDIPSVRAQLNLDFDYTLTQKGQFSVGIMETNGLKPLNGKPTRYWVTGPYSLTVRHDEALKYKHAWLNEEAKKILEASFAIADGDGVKGQSTTRQSGSDANSYPSFGGSIEISISRFAQRLTDSLRKNGIDMSKYNLYVGFTGARGDTGSNPGRKRRQNEMISYAGFVAPIGDQEFEVRVFKAKYERNPEGAESFGKEQSAVVSVGRGIELAYRGYQLDMCKVDLYASRDSFKNVSNQADGEFTWGNMRRMDGVTTGAKCSNLHGVQGLSVSFEVNRRRVDRPEAVNVESPGSGMKKLTFIATIGYKF